MKERRGGGAGVAAAAAAVGWGGYSECGLVWVSVSVYLRTRAGSFNGRSGCF